jgi:trehalose 6-phosphate phosphatase
MILPRWVERAVSEYKKARHLALFFDYDGTLAPIADHPSKAVLPYTTRETLKLLAALDGIKVGIVSGRPVSELKGLINLPELWYAGSGGMHIVLDGEELVDNTLTAFTWIADFLAVKLAELIKRFRGTWIERKPGCLTIHYRQLAQLDARCFIAEVRDSLTSREDSPLLRVEEVDLGIEVALAGSWDKGVAVDRMLDAWGGDPFVVYAGNAVNDEPAMIRVNDRKGTSIGIGPAVLAMAHQSVATPQEFSADLLRLSDELYSASAHRAHPTMPKTEKLPAQPEE